MSDQNYYEVCEKDGDCQQPAAIYYKKVVTRRGHTFTEGIRLCERHAQAVMPRAMQNPYVHTVTRLDQQEFPF